MKPHYKLVSLALFLLSFASAGLFISSCSEVTANEAVAKVEQKSAAIPPLYIRTGELSKSAEWDKTIQVVALINEDLKKDPQDVKSKIRLSEIYMNEARITGEHGHYYPAVLQILDQVLGQKEIDEDTQFRALSLKSSVLLSLHEFSAARTLAEKAVILRPHNAQIYGALVDANVELGQYEQAVSMATKMMDIRPDLLSYARASYLREIHGDLDGAIEAMELAVSSGFPGNENTAWSRLTLGGLYESKGDLTAAEDQYKTALQERPGYPFAIAALAEIENKKGNLAEAEELLEQAIAIIPEVSFNMQLAGLYKSTDRTELADKMVDEVMEMLADDEAHGHKMAMEYAKVHLHLTSDLDGALARALSEYEARPQNIDVNKLLAKVYYKKGDLQKAEEHLALAMRTSSESYDLLTIAGLIHAKNGQQDLALDLMKKSQELNPYQDDQFAQEAAELIEKS